MAETNRKVLFLVMAILLVGIVISQSFVDPDIKQIRVDTQSRTGQDPRSLMVQMPSQFLIASLTGFREVIASTLWVRASTFFEQGKYGPIVPIIRLVTWLDPHNIDFYLTGAWHMDYNFTDAYQLSDKRYIAPAISLLKEGTLNNPNTWDVYFEVADNHYSRKAENIEQTVKYLEFACQHEGVDPNTGAVTPRPLFVDRSLAMAYAKAGDFDKAIEQFEATRVRALRLIAEKKIPNDPGTQSQIDVTIKNEMILCYRLAYRYGDMKAYKKAVELAGVLKNPVYGPTNADYQRRLATNNPPADAAKPLNVGLDVKWERLAPRVIRITGKVNLIRWSEYKGLASEVLTGAYAENEKKNADKREIWRDGMKLRWMLTDLDYKPMDPEAFQWDLNLRSTVAWDTLAVAGGTFSRKLDFSKNPDIYPFLSKDGKYKLTVWAGPFEPNCPDFIGDRIGFKGEALADPLYLRTDAESGMKTVVKEFVLTQADLTGPGPEPKTTDKLPGSPSQQL